MGVTFKFEFDSLIISRTNDLKATNIETAVYPGFPTDLQQPFMTLLTYAKGVSTVEENIFENRFMQVPYIREMGARIDLKGTTAMVHGGTQLVGCEVVATDLRAGAALVLAALSANGVTVINNVEHILRGYEKLIEKLKDVGAKIELIEE